MNNDEQQSVPPTVTGLPSAAAGAKPAGKSRLPMIVGSILALLLVRWMVSGPSKANPVIGEWSLVDPAEAAYCPTYQEFTPSQSTYTQNGKTFKLKPIYDIRPGVTIVGYGTSYQGEWRPTGPNDMTLGQVGPPPYGVPSFCKYHRK